MAIVDADNMMTMPKGLTSASGIDVMTHALEAYVSVMASDYTDGLALQAIKNVFPYFLGVNHSLAHKLGAFHHLPHGVANALVLTYVIRYNAEEAPAKMGTFPQYKYPHAFDRYVEAARFAGITGKDDQEVFENLIQALEDLKEKIGIKKTIADDAGTEGNLPEGILREIKR